MPRAHAESSGAAAETALGDIERRLRAHPDVYECRVLERRSAGGPEPIAYVVSASAVDVQPGQLDSWLQAALPDAGRVSYVPVSSLPLTAEGEIDDEQLSRIPVVDEALIRGLASEIRASIEVQTVDIRDDDRASRRPAVHLAEAGAGWLIAGAEGAAATDAGPTAGRDRRDSGAAAAVDDPTVADHKPAEVSGGSLRIGPEDPRTLDAALLRRARATPDKGITLIESDGSTSRLDYATLLTRARCLLTGLRDSGLRAGDVVVLQIDRLDHYLPTFWACVLGGFRPMTVAVPSAYDARNSVVQKLFHAWELVGRPLILTTADLVEPIESLRRVLPMDSLRVVPVEALAGAPAESLHRRQPDDIAFLQLSSASTGASKCIQITDRGAIAHVLGTQQNVGMSADDVTLNWLPMDHVAPLLMSHVTDLYLGSEQIHVGGAVIIASPLKWLDLIERYRVTHTWSPNFGFKMVLDALSEAAGRSWDLTSIRAWVNGGEQVTLSVVRGFLDAVAPFGLHAGALQPAYGMAETCTGITYESAFDLDRGVQRVAKSSLNGRVRPPAADEEATTLIACGRPNPGVTVRITDRDNCVLTEGVIGRVQVHGDVITPGYFNNPDANREALVGDGWLNTGDLGFVQDGRLTLTGREKELIIIRGANFYCYDLEDIVSRVPGVAGTWVAACGIPDPASGSESLAIFFATDETGEARLASIVAAVRRQLTERAGVAPSHVIPLAKDAFPKTTSGKIQRGQLRERLLADEFALTLRRVDVWLENANTIPAWFHAPRWRRKALLATREIPGSVVVFSGVGPLASRINASLAAQGSRVIVVRQGSEFARHSDAEFEIDPDNGAHYRQVLGAIAAEKRLPPLVVHTWHLDSPSSDWQALPVVEAVRRHTTDVLLLAQALAGVREGDDRTRLVIAATQAQQVTDGDRIYPPRRPVVALLKTLAAELEWLDARHVDLPGLPGLDVESGAKAAVLECASESADIESAWRGDARFASCLEAVDLQERPAAGMPFRQGGLYVISGGCGGIGVEIARHLLTRFSARLVVIGRSMLDPLPADAPSESRSLEAAAVLAELRRLPGAIRYVQADICHGQQVHGLIAAACEDLDRSVDRIDGIFHCAAAYADRTLLDETPESLEATWRAKVIGGWTLHQLIADRPGTLFVSFSSIGSFFGGYGAGAYAAGNTFVEALAHYQRGLGIRSISFAFSLWNGVGLSRGFTARQAMRARGYRVIERQQGLASLLAGLGQDRAILSVGLDDANPQVGRRVVERTPRRRRLVARVTGPGADAAMGRMLVQSDRFGQSIECEVRRATTDDERLSFASTRDTVHEPMAPQTELQKVVAAVWSSVLKRDSVGMEDNFFDLGGNSLDVARVAGTLARSLQRSVSTTAIYQHPTVAAQATFLAGAADTFAGPQKGQSRGQTRRELARARAGRRGRPGES